MIVNIEILGYFLVSLSAVFGVFVFVKEWKNNTKLNFLMLSAIFVCLVVSVGASIFDWIVKGERNGLFVLSSVAFSLWLIGFLFVVRLHQLRKRTVKSLHVARECRYNKKLSTQQVIMNAYGTQKFDGYTIPDVKYSNNVNIDCKDIESGNNSFASQQAVLPDCDQDKLVQPKLVCNQVTKNFASEIDYKLVQVQHNKIDFDVVAKSGIVDSGGELLQDKFVEFEYDLSKREQFGNINKKIQESLVQTKSTKTLTETKALQIKRQKQATEMEAIKKLLSSTETLIKEYLVLIKIEN